MNTRTTQCKCGTTVEHWEPGQDVACPNCGTWFNAFGQELRSDWYENPAWHGEDIDDLTGNELAALRRE